jgi:malate dehydrogenase
MTTAGIIGAGDIGGAVAHALARAESAARIWLVDSAADPAAGKALDIQQSGAIEGFSTQLRGTSDITRIIGCDVCIVADRFAAGSSPPRPESQSEWQGDEGFVHLTRIAEMVPDMPLVFAGTSQAPLIAQLAREARIPRERLIGASPEALASAIRSIVAMEARCSPSEVTLTVLGTPPAGFVVPWSEASLGGYSLERVLSQVQLTRIAARAARLWPPGPFVLGQAAACVAHGIMHSARRAYSVLTMLEGEFGVRGRVGAIPASLSTPGIVHTRVPSLSVRERVQLETALTRE